MTVPIHVVFMLAYTLPLYQLSCSRTLVSSIHSSPSQYHNVNVVCCLCGIVAIEYTNLRPTCRAKVRWNESNEMYACGCVCYATTIGRISDYESSAVPAARCVHSIAFALTASAPSSSPSRRSSTSHFLKNDLRNA